MKGLPFLWKNISKKMIFPLNIPIIFAIYYYKVHKKQYDRSFEGEERTIYKIDIKLYSEI